MRTVASIVVVVHAVCATLLGGPAAAAGLDGLHGRRMLADSLAQGPAPLEVTGADSSCGHLDEPPCPNTGCANALEEDIGGVCKSAKFMNSYDGSGGMEDELDNGVGMGRYLLQLQRRERGTRDQPSSSNAPRTRTGKRAPRRARPTDPVRARTGKRAPRRARPTDPVRARTGKRAPRRARPTDPVRTRTGKRAPRRARPTNPVRTRTGKRAPRRARPSDPRRRSRNGKDTLARPSKPSRGRNSKRSPSPARSSRPARGHSGKGSSAHPPPRRSSHSHHSKGHRNKGHDGHRHHSRRHGHPSKGHRSHGHHSHGHHSHSHHGKRRDSNAPSTFKRFSSGHEGKGEGSDSTVYVKGDVETLFVTSTGDGYIGVSPHSGQYGVSPHSGQYGVTYVQYHGAPEVHEPPHLAPTVPSPPQHHRLRHAW